MEGLFAGEFSHSLDEKGRLAIPAKFRPRFREGAIVTRWDPECLALFTASEWEAIHTDIRRKPRTDPAVIRFQRFFVAGAHEAEPDGQGRIVIPQHLRDWAHLSDAAIVAGVSRNLEIWEPARWRAHLDEVEGGIAGTFAELGI
ncbi:MAG: division/cell wall cluster transcriptional repressor MraZ [Candidatus Limnocylindria bacterium]